MKLQHLGWDAFFPKAFKPFEGDKLIAARMVVRHCRYELLGELRRLQRGLRAHGARLAVRS
jgi:hypothetical protein